MTNNICFKACMLTQTDPTNLISEYNDTCLVGCSERCLLAPHCTEWTWWGDEERCQLFSDCTGHLTNCTDCQTGPR